MYYYNISKRVVVVNQAYAILECMITGVKNTSKGFALPTVLISSIVMLIVLLTTVVSTVAVRTALLNQYYGQMAQSAGESGLVYAKACLNQSGGIAGWSNAKPLMPNTDCSGNEIVACPTAAADPKCYVSNTGNAYSSFSIKAPVLDSSGNASVLPNSGFVKLVRDSNGATWRTYTSPASQPTQVPNLCSGNTDASDGWSNSIVYTGTASTNFQDPNAKFITSTSNSDKPGPQYFRRDFSVAEDGNYDIKLLSDDIGVLYIDGVQVASAAGWNNVVTVTGVPLSYGCHVATLKNTNGGILDGGTTFKMNIVKTGGSDSILVSDTSWRYTKGSLKHFSDVGYYAAPNAWTPVRDYQDANSMATDWNSTSGVPARAISTTHSYTSTATYPANSYTYFRDPGIVNVGSITDVKVTFICDDGCNIYLDGQVIAAGVGYTSYIYLTLSEGSHQFAMSGYNNNAGLSEFAMAVSRASDGRALTYTNSSWLAANFWESSLNDYYSYDKNFLPTNTTSALANVFVVGGGGGGANNHGGGGGGGGVTSVPSYRIYNGVIYPVAVGTGGNAGTISSRSGGNGGASAFGALTAEGGGGGGGRVANSSVTQALTGGSGGGGAGTIDGDTGLPGAGAVGISGQGYNGGNGSSNSTAGNGGGGGGAGVAGGNSSGAGGSGVGTSGAGGNGLQSSISGVASYYAGGGSGGRWGTGAVGAAGLGGGGLGGAADGAVGGNGIANTGGGAGGGGGGNANGGVGGSGIVIVSYPTGSITATGGIMTTSGGNTIHTFRISGGDFKVGVSPRTSCSAILNAGESTGNGPYWIYPVGSTGVQVYCDMTNDGGGWTLVLQNNSTVTTPAPNWNDAINNNTITGSFGFDLASFDNLLGLSHWNNIGNQVRLQVGTSPTNISHKATYNISLNTGNFYALSLSNENILLGGTQPGFYLTHNNQPFTTYDADHDANAGNCATNYQNHPWWYTSCWSGNFFAGGAYQDAPYWVGSTSDYHAYGSIWLK